MLKGLRIHSAIRQSWRKLGGEAAAIVIGKVIAMAAAIGGVRLLTEAMSPETYGQLSLFLTVSSFTGLLLFGPLSQGAQRFFSIAREQQTLPAFEKSLRFFYRYSVFMLLALFIPALLVCWALGAENWVMALPVLLACSVLEGAGSLLSAVQNAARHRVVVSWHEALDRILRIGFVFALVMWVGNRSQWALWGHLAAVCLVFVSQYFFYHREIKSKLFNSAVLDTEAVARFKKDILVYSSPFLYWSVVSWMQFTSDRWALNVFATKADVGYAAVLMQLGFQPVNIGIGMLSQLLAPILFEKAGDGSDLERVARAQRANRHIIALLAACTAAGFVVALLTHRLVFQWLVAPDFQSVSYLFPYMLLAGGLFGCGQFATLQLMVDMDTKRLILPKIVCSATAVLFNVLGARYGGIAGVTAALVASMALYFVWLIRMQKTDQHTTQHVPDFPA